VLRTGNKGLAAATLILDILKGTAAVLIAAHYGPALGLWAGFGAFIGHLFPIWLGFKGGKGVATYLGVLIGLHWPTALIFALVWLAVAFALRYSSVAALTASLTAPLSHLLFHHAIWAAILACMTVVLWLRHHANIRRLLAGEESRIGSRA
jgi:glycerol-3-phosphate acyltransferase PlsY